MNRIAWIVLAWACVGCGGSDPPPAHAPSPPAGQALVLEGAFVEPLREAALAYGAWGRVDALPNIAPLKCDMPRGRDFGSTGDVHLSSAGEDSPHGRKLYYLYAKDRAAYLALDGHDGAVPIGTTVVKEAFAPRSVTRADVDAMVKRTGELANGTYASFDPAPGVGYVELDGGYAVPDGALGLYILTKVGDADEPGTDDGWIYGTITPDGAVTSAGRVGTCMGCHVDQAPHERLFGLAPR